MSSLFVLYQLDIQICMRVWHLRTACMPMHVHVYMSSAYTCTQECRHMRQLCTCTCPCTYVGSWIYHEPWIDTHVPHLIMKRYITIHKLVPLYTYTVFIHHVYMILFYFSCMYDKHVTSGESYIQSTHVTIRPYLPTFKNSHIDIFLHSYLHTCIHPYHVQIYLFTLQYLHVWNSCKSNNNLSTHVYILADPAVQSRWRTTRSRADTVTRFARFRSMVGGTFSDQEGMTRWWSCGMHALGRACGPCASLPPLLLTSDNSNHAYGSNRNEWWRCVLFRIGIRIGKWWFWDGNQITQQQTYLCKK